jgi:pheromone shutdown protein TraB
MHSVLILINALLLILLSRSIGIPVLASATTGSGSSSSSSTIITDYSGVAFLQIKDVSNTSSSSKWNTTNNNNPELSWRQSLPLSLQQRKTLHRFTLYGCTVYLLGTSHISRSSCHDVQELMSHVKPDGLFLELCWKRIPILLPPTTNLSPTESKGMSLKEMAKQAQVQNPGMSYSNALSSAMLTKIQSNYATKLNITVGSEFRQAHELAVSSESKNCRVILGDRPVQITLTRCWESLSLWGKIKLVLGLIYSQIKQPSEKEMVEWIESVLSSSDNDVLTKSIQQLKDSFPTIARVVIEERDLFMFCKLVQMIRYYSSTDDESRMQTIVAVVGAGHCAGICRLVEEMKQLDEAYPRRNNIYHNMGFLPSLQLIESRLKTVIETKKLTVDNSEEVKGLLTDVIELQLCDEHP